jgi:hypothetical protein
LFGSPAVRIVIRFLKVESQFLLLYAGYNSIASNNLTFLKLSSSDGINLNLHFTVDRTYEPIQLIQGRADGSAAGAAAQGPKFLGAPDFRFGTWNQAA